MKNTKIKVQVDVMEVLKQVQNRCEKSKCSKCDFSFTDEYRSCACALERIPRRWELKKVGDKQ